MHVCVCFFFFFKESLQYIILIYLVFQVHRRAQLVGVILDIYTQVSLKNCGRTLSNYKYAFKKIIYFNFLFIYLVCTYVYKLLLPRINFWSIYHYYFFRYTYRLGHRLRDGSYVWSKLYSFKSSPYPGQDSLQRIIVFGDMGKVILSYRISKSLKKINIFLY